MWSIAEKSSENTSSVNWVERGRYFEEARLYHFPLKMALVMGLTREREKERRTERLTRERLRKYVTNFNLFQEREILVLYIYSIKTRLIFTTTRNNNNNNNKNTFPIVEDLFHLRKEKRKTLNYPRIVKIVRGRERSSFANFSFLSHTYISVQGYNICNGIFISRNVDPSTPYQEFQ